MVIVHRARLVRRHPPRKQQPSERLRAQTAGATQIEEIQNIRLFRDPIIQIDDAAQTLNQHHPQFSQPARMHPANGLWTDA